MAERWLKWLLTWLLPATRPMDNMEFHWDSPQEDEWALCNLGLPSPYLTILFPNHPPQYSDYVDLREVSDHDRRKWQNGLQWFLQCLTLRDPRRIVLKSPLHTCRVRAILEAFPDARFVHISRNPYAIFPSMIHTWRRLHKDHGAQRPRHAGLEQHVLATLRRMYDCFEEDRALIDPARFCEVRFEDLIRNPGEEMERIYHAIGLDGFKDVRPTIVERAERMSGYQPNRLEVAHEIRGEIERQWRPYIERYGPW